MSYWVSLIDDKGDFVIVDNFCEGGTYVVGGTEEADLNVTYNYAKYTHQYLKEGLKSLHNKKAKKFIKVFEKAVKQLGTEQDTDYWKATKGNVGYMFNILLKWAKQYPEAIFKVI
jgi:hypothetical protein